MFNECLESTIFSEVWDGVTEAFRVFVFLWLSFAKRNIGILAEEYTLGVSELLTSLDFGSGS
jgi:hypothetical protein